MAGGGGSGGSCVEGAQKVTKSAHLSIETHSCQLHVVMIWKKGA